MQHDYYVQLAHHYRMNMLHDDNTTRCGQCSISYHHSQSQALHYMLSAMMQTLLVRMLTCYSELCHDMSACANVFHYSRMAPRSTTSPIASRGMLGNNLCHSLPMRGWNVTISALR